MIASNTNALVYAHRRESTFHDAARQAMGTLASSGSAWAIAWPWLQESYGVVTHPQAFKPASTLGQACCELSADRDFTRFPSLKVRNPLIG